MREFERHAPNHKAMNYLAQDLNLLSLTPKPKPLLLLDQAASRPTLKFKASIRIINDPRHMYSVSPQETLHGGT